MKIKIFLILFLSTNAFANIYKNIDGNRRYNEVVWLTAHNAFANYRAGWSIVNQTRSIKDLMENFNVRGLMLDIYRSDQGSALGLKRDKPEIVSCHGECDISVGVLRVLRAPRLLSEILKIIKTFLDNNPKEIITIIFEDYVDGKYRGELTTIFEEVGLTKYWLKPEDSNLFDKVPVLKWPTINKLRSTNKRLIVFSPRGGPFIGQWAWMVENHYNYAEDKGANCEKRGESREHLNMQPHIPLNINLFYNFAFDTHAAHVPEIRMINHGLLNGPMLKKYIEEKCLKYWKRLPTFISLDHAHRYTGIYGGTDLRDYIKELNKKPVEDFYADKGQVEKYQLGTPEGATKGKSL